MGCGKGRKGEWVMGLDADVELYTGDTELLETAASYFEVLSRGGGSKCEVAEELYEWVLGGMFCISTSSSHIV